MKNHHIEVIIEKIDDTLKREELLAEAIREHVNRSIGRDAVESTALLELYSAYDLGGMSPAEVELSQYVEREVNILPSL